ncbi:MAG: LamG-like jellyroll fold domain-containing protein [Phycisphaerae bacterium]
MKKNFLLLTALIISLIGSSNILANDLQNPGFEGGNIGWFGDPGFTIPGWVFWGTDGWIHNNAGAYIDTRAMLIWSDAPGIIQDFAVTEDREYTFSVSTYSPVSDNHGLHGMDGVFQVEWYDVDNYLIYAEEIGRFYGAMDIDVPIDPYDTWKVISANVVAPIPATRCRVFLHLVGNGGSSTGGVVSWDEAYVGLAYAAEDPSPANNSTVDPTVSTTLSWTRPAPRQTGDTILCDVWFGADGNMPGTNTKILDKQDADSVVVGALDGNKNYYWKVDCYDPDGSGPEIKTEGYTWTFNTQNAPPTVDAGLKQAVWLSSGTATAAMDVTVTDDGLPSPPASLTYEWTVVSGPATPAFSPSNTVENPDVIFNTAGDYVLRLTVDDSDKDANDTVLVKVYAEGYTGLVAHWALDETSGTTAVDSVGGHNGTLVGNATWAAGKVNGAILLDGDGDYIDCGGGSTTHEPPTWADLRDEITVSAWVKGTFDKWWQAIVNKGDSSWRLLRNSDPTPDDNISLILNGIGPVVSGSTGPVGDNQWHQVVGTFDGLSECVYVDGILAASREIPEGALIDLNNYNVRIGSDEQFDGQREFNGLIDEVRLYEIGLPADKVLEQFIADGGSHSCGTTYLVGDINKDCYIDFADFAQMAENWLKCNDVANSNCQ